MTSTYLEVLATGPRTLIQDLGRPGLAHLGVGRSGAADRASHLLAQRLLGNPGESAGLEITLGGFRARAHGDCLVALTGADAPLQVAGRPIGHAALQYVAHGQEISLGMAERGLRVYLAVRGGIDVKPVLGSRSHDTLCGLGPEPVLPGTLLPIGTAGKVVPSIDAAPTAPAGLPEAGEVVLTYEPGPRADWLAQPGALAETSWRVSNRSDRVGIRLENPDGITLARHPDKEGVELASEGVVRGSIQVPSGGEPVIFLADHPVTGGYPVAGIVVPADVDRAAQARPGQRLRLRRG
ncbi:5-oxoprolinase subunit C family protein [Gephyromycinifex aptenodytis]|uniref:5-oxoprolinase subunit C family protein n=1 Tax=Gephyromycinifex aptenodytis TaxID=2716227 RepID=UPI001446ACA8|nr:biotin-dependent carboxyltransferase family protein [Gephyromycinifex aptenodytis]